MTTSLAQQIVDALFDQASADGGLLKDRAVKRVAEVLSSRKVHVDSPYVNYMSIAESDDYDARQDVRARAFDTKYRDALVKEYEDKKHLLHRQRLTVDDEKMLEKMWQGLVDKPMTATEVVNSHKPSEVLGEMWQQIADRMIYPPHVIPKDEKPHRLAYIDDWQKAYDDKIERMKADLNGT